ncbi:hypothetical protein GWI34_10035 [Actinomadura sp. DSM 109109]|nr:hypothetical protein [Actinomadura lepetitiana]
MSNLPDRPRGEPAVFLTAPNLESELDEVQRTRYVPPPPSPTWTALSPPSPTRPASPSCRGTAARLLARARAADALRPEITAHQLLKLVAAISMASEREADGPSEADRLLPIAIEKGPAPLSPSEKASIRRR